MHPDPPTTVPPSMSGAHTGDTAGSAASMDQSQKGSVTDGSSRRSAFSSASSSSRCHGRKVGPLCAGSDHVAWMPTNASNASQPRANVSPPPTPNRVSVSSRLKPGGAATVRSRAMAPLYASSCALVSDPYSRRTRTPEAHVKSRGGPSASGPAACRTDRGAPSRASPGAAAAGGGASVPPPRPAAAAAPALVRGGAAAARPTPTPAPTVAAASTARAMAERQTAAEAGHRPARRRRHRRRGGRDGGGDENGGECGGGAPPEAAIRGEPVTTHYHHPRAPGERGGRSARVT